MVNPQGLPDWWFKHSDDDQAAQGSGPVVGYVTVASQVFAPGMTQGNAFVPGCVAGEVAPI